MSRIPIRIKNGNHVFPHRRACVLRHASLPGNGQTPALRPSHPHGCRKRAFRQGQALRGRFAGLDVHALASGLIYSRATDEEASGGGSVKGSSQTRSTKTQKIVSRRLRFSRILTRGGNDTCKSVPAYALQSFPDTYSVASRPASDVRAVMRIMLNLPCVRY